MKKLIILFSLVTQVLLFQNAESMEADRLHKFFVEHQNSEEAAKWHWDSIAYAVEKGYVDVASFLVVNGGALRSYDEQVPTDPNNINTDVSGTYKDTHYKHPLNTAIRKGYSELAIEMIQMGADPNEAIEYKKVWYKYRLSQTQVINKQKEIDRKSARYVILGEGKDVSLLHTLLSLGMSVNEEIKEGNANVTHPLNIAIQHNNLDMARELLNLGAVTEDHEYSPQPLSIAIGNNSKEAVNLLLEYGANPLFKRKNLESPLELAIRLGREDLVDLLLSAVTN